MWNVNWFLRTTGRVRWPSGSEGGPKWWPFTIWGGAVGNAVPADTKALGVVAPETVLNSNVHDKIQRNLGDND